MICGTIPDPRFGDGAPVPTNVVIKTPSPLTYVASESRDATMNSPIDPLGLANSPSEPRSRAAGSPRPATSIQIRR